MNTISDRADINQLLTQMRAMREQVQEQGGQVQRMDLGLGREAAERPSGTREVNFTEMLRQAVDTVNDSQQKAAELQRAFDSGDPDVDITQVMIQMQKADVSFEAMTQVRNRLISAYQDIMNMPI